MSRTLIDAVDRFVTEIAAALTEVDGTDAEEAHQRALADGHDLVAGFIDADAQHTDEELRGYLSAVGPWIDPRLSEATVDEVRAAGLLSGARARLQEPGPLFDELLAADARDGGLRAWTFKQRAMDLGHEVAALDLRTSPGEVDAVGRFRRRCHAAIREAGVDRPSERRPAGGLFAGQPSADVSATDRPPEVPGDVPTAPDAGLATPVASQAPADGGPAERTRARHVDEVLDELTELPGLDPVKAEISLIADLLLVQRMREDRGLPTVPGARHLAFTGNVGTRKTTVARLVAEIYAGVGVVANGHLVETDRADLLAGGDGPTAERTREIVTSAIGGVLLIDEADTLAQDGPGALAAIDTLAAMMDTHRRELVIILAGEADGMARLLSDNPRLASRFPRTVHFPEDAHLAAEGA